jgi:hypothetical protein
MTTDVLTEAYAALKDNLPPLVGMGLIVYGFAKVWLFLRDTYRSAKAWIAGPVDERIPAAVKASLSNGGGGIIRAIISAENQKQTAHHRAATEEIVAGALAKHTAEESVRLDQKMDDVFDRLNKQRRSR